MRIVSYSDILQATLQADQTIERYRIVHLFPFKYHESVSKGLWMTNRFKVLSPRLSALRNGLNPTKIKIKCPYMHRIYKFELCLPNVQGLPVTSIWVYLPTTCYSPDRNYKTNQTKILTEISSSFGMRFLIPDQSKIFVKMFILLVIL